MEAETHVPNHGRAKQIVASLLVSLITLHGGMLQGWPSPMSLKLKQADSPVETMTVDELATLSTVPGIFSLATTFVLGIIAQKFGRKVAMYTIGTASAIGGAVLTFAPSKIYLYIGRTFAGSGSGIFIAFTFISEIVHESIRGTMMAMCTFQLNVGILISYTAGAKLSYKLYNSILTILPIVYTIFLVFIPETPLFLAEKSRIDDAKKSMLWYRGGNQDIAERELLRLTSSKNDQEENITVCDILKRKITRLAMIIGVSAYIFQALSGIFEILNYAGIIFEESGSVMSPEDSSIVIALILLGSSVVNVLLMDKLGRKPLLYFSFIGGAIGMSVLAIFLYVRMKGAEVEHLGWIPISSLGLYVFTYGVGLAAVPGALLNEVSPTNIRPTCGAMVGVSAFFIMIIIVQTFPYMDDGLGLYSVFVIPALANVAGLFFTYFVVPETKGKSLAEIEEELKNR